MASMSWWRDFRSRIAFGDSYPLHRAFAAIQTSSTSTVHQGNVLGLGMYGCMMRYALGAISYQCSVPGVAVFGHGSVLVEVLGSASSLVTISNARRNLHSIHQQTRIGWVWRFLEDVGSW